jgi:hypothetical protein
MLWREMPKQSLLLLENCGALKQKALITVRFVATNYSGQIKNLSVVVAGLVSLNKKTSRVLFLKTTTLMECNASKPSAEDVTVTLDIYLTTDQNPLENGIA